MFNEIFNWLGTLFNGKKSVRLALYGPPNVGKTTIANRVCKEWKGRPLGKASNIPHETKHVQEMKNVKVDVGGKKEKRKMSFSIVDTPGICASLDYKRFMRYNMSRVKARRWALEASIGVSESLEWLDKIDAALIVFDSTMKDIKGEMNFTVDYLRDRKVPFLIVANKIDLKKADPERIQELFPGETVVAISALTGQCFEDLYFAMRMFER